MKILAIETSCDETSVAIIKGKGDKIKVIYNIVASQIKLHRKTKGVVPEVAARAHLEKLLPLIKQSAKAAKFYFKTGKGIDAIAVASGPGLITALLVGVETAKTLALLWNKPIIPVNHIAAHIYSSLIPLNNIQPKWKFPVLALAVSGGHTELILIKNNLQFKKIGATLDDAAGEAFDKVAKILNLPYPGGPEIEKMARNGNPKAFNFPRPMISSKDFNFSFSGLKTAVLYTVQKRYKIQDTRYKIQDMCASFQQAVVDVLVSKTVRAVKEYKVRTVCLVGGVAANILLRQTLEKKISEITPASQFLVPEKKYCMDNAAMIGAAAYFELNEKRKTKNEKLSLKKLSWEKVEADANWEL
ncbi:tRNA (adenosine(37)-N6)-threonylcarbamoyltransferase complex transferase subunit TsaD [Patescibacteria group bacterium]|nr:MAG: tRNA (adenosine(37)-N6)-threonylcarbamoyltransferase complex transferase subunit TsaD [Patescibacteria group bacterium]